MEKNCMSLTDFVYLLLATLAQKNLLIDFRNKNIKTVVLPLNYKEVIEEILCQGNGWKEEFSILIDMDEYFNNHFLWKKKFTKELIDTINKLDKKMEYDLEFDRIIIRFSNQEVKNILDRYYGIDDNIQITIDHFANLLNDFIFTRRYKEEFIPRINVVERNIHELNKHNLKDNDDKSKDNKSNLLIRTRRMK